MEVYLEEVVTVVGKGVAEKEVVVKVVV